MKNITIIAGPTASGKTDFSIKLAFNLKEKNKKAIIINADASAIYKNFPILTAQPQDIHRKEFPHFLFDIAEINEAFSIGKWVTHVENILVSPEWKDCHKIIVGGTCLYIFLLIKGLIMIPAIHEDIRIQAKAELAEMGRENFLSKVKLLDKNTPLDTQRLINNYSLILQTGKTFQQWQSSSRKFLLPEESFELIKISPDRKQIYERCDRRFIQMIERGAEAEVRNSIEKYGADYRCNKIIGYNEIKEYILGNTSLEMAISTAQKKTRHLAKSQFTWLNNKL